MRGSLGLISLLIALAVIIFLFSRQASDTERTVRTVSLSAIDNVTPRAYDAEVARGLVDRLRSLLEAPEPPSAELRQAAETAASWAAGARPGSPEHHIAVSLRAAAVELLAAGPSLDDPRRATARRHLSSAANTSVSNRAPDSASGIRDQLQNIQTSLEQQRRDPNQVPE